jgi:2-deoxy-D-gluconate 3-dehydrogenase
MLLENKVAVVTGGAQGIGKGIALKLAEEGAKVAVLDIKDASTTAGQIQEAGGQAKVYLVNVTKLEDVKNAFDDILNEWERIDILVNNAGIYPLENFTDISVDRVRMVMEINFMGTFICSQQAARAFLAKGIPGTIINISSAAGITPEKYHAHYAASKAAVIAFSKAIALELGPRGIRVNVVAPGAIETEGAMDPGLFPDSENIPEDFQDIQIRKSSFLGKMGSPEDVASVVLFLASEKASYFSGAVISVDGGRTLL